MKKHLLLVLVLMFSLFTYSQNTTVKDGPYKKYYKNGQLKTSGQYQNKLRVGDWKSFYETGELSSVYSYTNGKRNKISKSFYKDGTLKYDTKKVGGVFVKKGYYETGNLFFERLLTNGYYKEYFESGALKIESNYLDNQLSGVWKKFFESGEKEWEVTYKEDYKEGNYKKFYKNGKLKVEGNHKENKKEGKEKRYFKNGQIEIEGYNNDGYFNKKWIVYNKEGNKINEIKFKKGELISFKTSDKLIEVVVPDGVNEHVPIFPGCEIELNNRTQKKCMSDGISKVILTNFNTDMAADLNLIGRQKIYLIFKIDKEGNITNIDAKAPHPKLKNEAIRVAGLLPKMKPGKQFGNSVVVPYSMPIVFQVQK